MRVVVFLLLLTVVSSPAAAQDPPGLLANALGDLPAAPVAPEVVNRDAHGNATIRATRLTGPFVLDGRLDEELYRSTRFISDFVQQEPFDGMPATERTDVWVFFDADHVYVSARNWETNTGRRVMSDMQRDARNLYNNDHFGVMFDTFRDHRNGYYFYANAQGGMSDGQIGNESPNSNWNGLWEVRTANFDGGWTIEFKFPFRSVRFDESGTAWGINFRRIVRWKNEVSFLTPIARSIGRSGLLRVSLAGTVVGLEPPQGLRNIDVKPYLSGSRLTNRTAAPPITGQRNGDVGVDVKWGVKQNVVADLTYNTDFAQVEDDEAQVNLTRFSVFFPEKREFFLEGQDSFSFGGDGFGGGGGGGGGFGPGNAPVLFYSRRIGLANGRAVPIVGGGRVVGRAGGFQIGALHIRTGESAIADARPTDYSVVRISRDLLSRSRIGLLATRRGVPASGSAATNYTYGADLALNLTTTFTASAYWAGTHDQQAKNDTTSYRAKLNYNSDRFGFGAEHILVGANFNPEVGFLRRTAFRRSFSEGRYSPRPANLGPVRKIFFESKIDYYADPAGDLESRSLEGHVPPRVHEHRQGVDTGDRFDRAARHRGESRGHGPRRSIRLSPGQSLLRTVPVAPLIRIPGRGARRLLRWHHHRSVVARPCGTVVQILCRALALGESGAHAVWQQQQSSLRWPDHVHPHASNVPLGVGAVPCRQPHDDRQCPLPVGVRAWERPVSGLQRWPLGVRGPIPVHTREPVHRRQGHAPVSLVGHVGR